MTDWNELGQRSRAAEMVQEVIVSGDQVIDAFEASFLGGDLYDATRVATTGIARIDQDRFAAGVTSSVAAPPSVSIHKIRRPAGEAASTPRSHKGKSEQKTQSESCA